MNKIELENRLIDFSVNIVGTVNLLESRKENEHLKEQIIRSSSARRIIIYFD